MTERTHLQIQVIELGRLLESSEDDPILAPQLRSRIDEVKRRLSSLQTQAGTLFPEEMPTLPRAAIFLRGGGVRDSEGIRAGLAGEALTQYEKMFTERALHDEREAARKAGRQRRRRGSPTPGLYFTGTPRGSFGLEFIPEATEDEATLMVHAESLEHVADDLTRIASPGDSLDDAIRQIPTRVLQPLKHFLKVLADHDIELRLAFPDKPSRRLTAAQIKTANERLDREVRQETEELAGVFRGVTRESVIFDLKTDTEVITGTVDDTLTEEDIDRIDALTNERCIATLQKTTVVKVGGQASPTYVLLEAREESNPSSLGNSETQ